MPNLQQFRNLLAIQRHRLDEELEIQPQVQDMIGEELARLNSRQLEAKDALTAVESRLFVQFKEDKMANELANAEVRLHRDRVAAWQRYQVARQEYEQWQGLHAAWVSRGYQLKTLADLYVAQYFTIDTTRRSAPEDKNSLRRQLREASSWTPPAPAPAPTAALPRRRATLT